MIEEFVDNWATICDAAAHVLIDGLVGSPAETKPTPFWEWDRRTIENDIGSDEPHQLIHEIVSTCLSESANIVLALAALLRARTVTVSLDLLVRAVVERVGVVNWVLDPDASSRQRAIRGTLGFIVSLQHYREALSGLGADAKHRAMFKAERTRLDGLATSWFLVDRPPIDPEAAKPKPTKDALLWTIENEKYPTLTRFAELAFANGAVGDQASAIYDALSGFSHPSVIFSQEHRSIGEGG